LGEILKELGYIKAPSLVRLFLISASTNEFLLAQQIAALPL